MTTTHNELDSEKYAKSPKNVLEANGFVDENGEIVPDPIHPDEDDSGCAGGACSLVTDPDGSPDHPEAIEQ